MRKTLFMSLALLLMLCSEAWAQGRPISGKVTDAGTGQPLPGVGVAVKGTTSGTFTGHDGSYTLSVPTDGTTLIFRYLGYTTIERSIGSGNTVDVALSADQQQLAEVVVVGYGVQDVKDVTGSITSISAAKIENQPVQSFDQALSGRAAGVQITNTSGIVADGVTVRIRGVGSISNSAQPLYVIDGIPMAQVSNLNSFNGGNGTRYNPLADLNPNDIESIEVLKDAAAAALYGSRAANGVVMVTTKRGKAGTAKVSYDFYSGFSEVANRPNLLDGDDFITIQNEKAANRFGPEDPRSVIAGNVDLDEDGRPDRTDWLDQVFQRGNIQNHQLSMSGGSEKTSYYGSVSYTDQHGVVVSNRLRRGSARLNLDITPKEWLRAGISTSYSKTLNNGVLSNSYLAGVTVAGYNAAPNLPVYNRDGSYYLNDGGYLGDGANKNAQYFLNRFYHPLGTLKLQQNDNTSQRIFGNAYVEIQPIKDLKITSKYGIDYIDNFENQYSDPSIYGLGWSYNGLVQTNNLRRNQWNWSNYATYNVLIGNQHNVSATAGIEYQEVEQFDIGAYAGDFADPFFRDIITGSFAYQPGSDGGKTHNGFDSYFGRLSYDYGNKYYAELALRADAFSGFGINNKRGYFPAGSIGWRISQESFMKQFTFLDDLKLRASYGIVGNSNIADFASRTLYGGGLYVEQNGFSPVQVGNKNLKWETSNKLDIGFDLSVLNNRIGLTFDYFYTDISDLVLNAPVLRTTGIPNASVSTNIGSMYNKGIELALNTVNLEKNGFTWSSSVNFTAIKNEVTSLFNDVPVVHSSGHSEAAVGHGIGEFKLVRWAGVNPDNGFAMFLTKDDVVKQYNPATDKYYLLDGTETSPITGSDAVYAGNPYPKWFGGFDNTFTYKQFDLGVFFQYSGGNKILNQTRAGLMTGYLNNNLVEIKDRWQKPGDVTDVPRLYLQDPQSNRISTRWLEDGDFLRLRQLSLGYNVPSATTQKVGLSSIRLYAQAQNLFVLTKYKGADPEVNTNRDVSIAYGFDNRSVPQARSFTVGVNVGF
ncbi:TonB-dependent receptor [Pontibacter sp. FD36]|uniref:SusC/RagA family TonB-linked outer membrane protein n=1 Tax=Pontibacter sp. FD36 TaxID=2789860 RepID=UPI0018AC6BD0|nr:TonB-dependent receptor [Pontibacter sp. FD36]MBF8964071.1 TonB-dependent receptor [Pontibacter sp. FD36]